MFFKHASKTYNVPYLKRNTSNAKFYIFKNKNLDNRVSFFSHLYDIWTGQDILGDLLFVSSAIDSEVWQETLNFFSSK